MPRTFSALLLGVLACGGPDESACPRIVWYADADGDGWGDAAAPFEDCEPPPDAVTEAGDCDDTDPTRSPVASEICDGRVDNDCDGLADDGDPSVDPSGWTTFHTDGDGDGYGDVESESSACEAPSGSVVDATDCDDTRAEVNPGLLEACDGVDNDCDLLVDDADPSLNQLTRSAWYPDADGDGYGDDDQPEILACAAPLGRSATPGDCDDGAPEISPAATEVCGGGDEDCDGLVDGEDPSVDLTSGTVFFTDGDQDGFGDPTTALTACVAGPGEVGDSTDCDDLNPEIYPGSYDYCGDGLDTDCVVGDASCRPLLGGDHVLTTLTTWVGGDTEERLGLGVALPGDMDGDGDEELLLSALGYDSSGYVGESGKLLVLGGPVAEGFQVAASVDLTTLQGANSGDQATRVAAAGDTDGDGLADALVGAPGSDAAGANAGGAYVIRRPVAGIFSLATAALILSGGDGEEAGSATASTPDFDGDGLPDLLVGAWQHDTGALAAAGAVYAATGAGSGVVPLASFPVLEGVATGDEAGTALAGADFDGDGLGDVLLGATGCDAGGVDRGTAFLILAPYTGVESLGSAEATFEGEADGDAAGASVAALSDFDQDGLPDLLIGAPTHSDAATWTGRAYVLSGGRRGTVSLGTADVIFDGSVGYDRAGLAVADGADLDQDGVPDLVISGGGKAWLVRGPTQGGMDLADADGIFSGSELGALAGGRDVDGDGFPDLLIGANRWSANPYGTGEGAGHLLFGGPF